ncbi:MAG: glycosyltransferase family 4 protein [Chloroflexota bacterium]|nr:glycosyltransferase family 4 protein [Chloroflexota bacterium]
MEIEYDSRAYFTQNRIKISACETRSMIQLGGVQDALSNQSTSAPVPKIPIHHHPSMNNPPILLIVSGPDVNTRIPLMNYLGGFQIAAAGSERGLEKQFAREGYPFYYYPLNRTANPIADLISLVNLTLLFQRLRPDIVHTFSTKPGVWGRIAAKLAGVPVIIGTLPGLGTLYADESFISRFIRTIYQPLQKLACTHSNLTIFQNPEDAGHFISSGIVAENKARVILSSGVETDIYDPEKISLSQKERVRTELGISSDILVVTMISRLLRSKGVIELAEAAYSVKQKYSDVEFLLIGSEDPDSIERLTSDELLNLGNNIIYSDARSDISAVLAATDIFVFPSYYREGVPRVLLEAASMGLPLITTDNPGCKEVLDGNGLLIPARDSAALVEAVLKLLADPVLRDQFGRKSRELAISKFDLLLIAEQTQSVYLDLLSGTEK